MNEPAIPTQRADTLTEQQFEHFYRHALRFRNQGLLDAARDTYLLLFDRSREVGGFGVTRLSFVIDDLMVVLREIDDAGTASSDASGSAAESPFAPVEARRNLAEERICTGVGGFIDAQEVVALNRALGQPQRSAELYDSLAAHELDTALGSEPQDEYSQRDAAIRRAREELGHLIWRELAPKDSAELADQASRDPALWLHVVDLARQVAWWIAELRVREDFPGTTWVYRESYLRWLGSQIEDEGVAAFALLLGMATCEPPKADPPLPDAGKLVDRLQSWLLAYQPNASMLTKLTVAARRAKRVDLVDQLQEEAWSLLDEEALGEFARAIAEDPGHRETRERSTGGIAGSAAVSRAH